LEAGAIFDVAGSALFPKDPLFILAVLNSSVARELLAIINPTVNFQVGDLAELPIPNGTADLQPLVQRAIDLQRHMDQFDQTTTDFVSPMPWQDAEQRYHEWLTEMAKIETAIDQGISELYGTHVPSVACDQRVFFDPLDLACRWIVYAIGQVLMMYPMICVDPIDPSVLQAIRDILIRHVGSTGIPQIEQQVGGLPKFLAGGFFRWQMQAYRRRPIYWQFRSRTSVVVRHDAPREVMREAFNSIGEELPHNWVRHIDDGVLINLSPLRQWTADKTMRRLLDETAHDLSTGRYPWAQTKWS
jgi:hypothetical protein